MPCPKVVEGAFSMCAYETAGDVTWDPRLTAAPINMVGASVSKKNKWYHTGNLVQSM